MKEIVKETNDLSHLDTVDGGAIPDSSTASNLEDAIDRVKELEEEIYEVEKTLLALKDSREYLLKKYIPRLLTSVGTTLLRTAKGFKVSIRLIHYLKVKDKARLEDYLEARGDAGLLDTTLRINKLTLAQRKELRTAVTKMGGFVAKLDHSLHHSRQRKYFNDLITTNPEELDRIKTIGDVSDYYETRIHKETQ